MTTQLEQAARLALEALEEVTGWQWAGPMRVIDEVEDAITALRAALEQPAQDEPVAYGMWDTQLGRNRMMMVRLDKGQDGCTVPLYAKEQA